jgi:FAD/FMN-containing dehydrogenase
LEEKPLAVVAVAAAASVATAVVLAASAGWPKVLRLVFARHAWIWLAVCLVSEVVAYFGYVLTLRDMARVDDGPEMDLAVSAETVVAGSECSRPPAGRVASRSTTGRSVALERVSVTR